MTKKRMPGNQVRQHRSNKGLTQAELAELAGISRTAVTAIEGARLVPSVAAALALAKTLGTNVEELFGSSESVSETEVWAWKPNTANSRVWRAEVGGQIVLYPADSIPTLTELPDQPGPGNRTSAKANETLVIASCDPAAGMLARQFNQATGMRLIVLSRSSQQAVKMLRDGLVHLAGLHLSTGDDPERNACVVRKMLGVDYQMARLAWWQEGVVVTPKANLHSLRSVMHSKLNWIGREAGSGARQCLDRLFENRQSPRRIASNHRQVAEAIRSGWAEAGVCVQLVSAEAGLVFLPVQQEAFDVCFPASLADDRRIKAFLSVVRSPAYRSLLGELPGYDARETGMVWGIN